MCYFSCKVLLLPFNALSRFHSKKARNGQAATQATLYGSQHVLREVRPMHRQVNQQKGRENMSRAPAIGPQAAH